MSASDSEITEELQIKVEEDDEGQDQRGADRDPDVEMEVGEPFLLKLEDDEPFLEETSRSGSSARDRLRGSASSKFSKEQLAAMGLFSVAIAQDMKTKVERKQLPDGDETLTCTECGYENYRLETFRGHLALHRPDNPYSCPTCGRLCTTLALLNVHMKTHLDNQSYECSECQKMFKNKLSLNSHKQYVHSARNVKCPECPKTFPTLGAMKVHLPVHTKLEDRHHYNCDHCEQTFVSRIGWVQHMNKHAGVEKERRHVCYFCGHRALSPTQLEQHLTVHTLEKPFKCFLCNLRLTCLGSLRGHMTVHKAWTPDTLIPCTYQDCSQKFRRKPDLQKHLSTVHNRESQIKHACPEPSCQFSTYWEKHLRRHIKHVHKKEYDFRCDQCGKGLCSQSWLDIHMSQVHSAKRPFVCDFIGCEKGFVNQYRLNQHKRTHSSDRLQHGCCFCGVEYKNKASLNTHLRKSIQTKLGRSSR